MNKDNPLSKMVFFVSSLTGQFFKHYGKHLLYFFSLIQKSVFCPLKNISPAAIAGVAMKI